MKTHDSGAVHKGLNKIQDILEARSMISIESSGYSEYKSEDDIVLNNENISHKNSLQDLHEFECCKNKQYHLNFLIQR